MSSTHKPGQPRRLRPKEALEGVVRHMDDALRDPTGVFREPFEHLKAAKGKMLRARLGIQTALGEDGTVPASLPPRLAAVELLHLATLVHDDILDAADTRRGQPSLRAAFSDKTAVLAGDYLLTRCFSLCMPAPDELPADAARYMELLSAAMARLCRGEMLQQKGRFNVNLTVREYLRIISGKTGSLFALAALTGAATAGKPEAEQRLLAELGYRMGMLFQMRDDQIDLLRDRSAAGKDTGSDLAGGIMTLPVILAFQEAPALRAEAAAGRTRRRADRCLSRLPGPGRTALSDLLAQADPAAVR